MNIIIPKPSKKALKKNGWEYSTSLQLYRKNFNKCLVCIRLPYECWIPYEEVTLNDLIAIGNEIKKLEEK